MKEPGKITATGKYATDYEPSGLFGHADLDFTYGVIDSPPKNLMAMNDFVIYSGTFPNGAAETLRWKLLPEPRGTGKFTEA